MSLDVIHFCIREQPFDQMKHESSCVVRQWLAELVKWRSEQKFQNNKPLKYWHKSIFSRIVKCCCERKRNVYFKFWKILTIYGKHDPFADCWRHAIGSYRYANKIRNHRKKREREWKKNARNKKMKMDQIFGFNQIIPMQRKAPFICRFACRSINVDPLIVKTARRK